MKTPTKRTLTIMLLVLLNACGGSTGNNNPAEPPIANPPVGQKLNPEKARLDPGLSCQAYKSYIIDALVDRFTISQSQCFDCPFAAIDVASPTGDLTVSQTNIQEAAVDEADIIKADDEGILYIAHGERLIIATGFPPTDLETIASLSFARPISGLVLDDALDRLMVIFYSGYDPIEFGSGSQALQINRHNSTVKFYDTSDPHALVELSEVRFSGRIRSERYLNNELFVIAFNHLPEPPSLYSDSFNALLSAYRQAQANEDTVQIAELSAQIRTVVTNAVDAQAIEEHLPAQVLEAPDGGLSSTPWLDCEDIYAPDVSVTLGLATVLKFSPNGEYLEGLAAITSFSDIYMSTNNIFLSQKSSSWWWGPVQDSETAIHQIAIDAAAMQYVGVGVIPGIPRNRFNFSEYEGHLRVATSEDNWNDEQQVRERTNHMHVLKLDSLNDPLIVGKTASYGIDEQIFSARFVGTKGYVVTFRQIDPLFTFDLSIPESPQLIGELEIPGFSEYIHPVGENRLITIGQNGNADGTLPGVRLQLFDVSDINSPMLLHSYVPMASNGSSAYSWSPSSYEPHAFTYFADDKILSIPLTIYSEQFAYGHEFSGFVVMRVSDNEGFVELGRVDHDDLAQDYYCEQPTGPLISDCQLGSYALWTYPQRSMVMKLDAQSYLYTLTDVGLKASPAETPDDIISSISLLDF